MQCKSRLKILKKYSTFENMGSNVMFYHYFLEVFTINLNSANFTFLHEDLLLM